MLIYTDFYHSVYLFHITIVKIGSKIPQWNIQLESPKTIFHNTVTLKSQFHSSNSNFIVTTGRYEFRHVWKRLHLFLLPTRNESA